MWMTDYVRAVKCALRDQHGFIQVGGTDEDPSLDATENKDGSYECMIDGKKQEIIIRDGKFYFPSIKV